MLKFYKNLVWPQENISIVTYQLLLALGVKVTQASLQRQLEQHPRYPSLLSVSDALNHFRVENLTARLSIERIKALDQPFLTLLKAEDQDVEHLCLIKSVSPKGVISLNSKTGKKNKYNWKDFERIYGGIALLAAKDEASGEREFKKNRKLEKINKVTTDLLFLFAPMLTLVVAFYNFYSTGFSQNIFPFIYSLLSVTGFIVASLLLWFEVDSSNKVLLDVCGGKNSGHITGCGAVLKSEASSFLGVSWSIWGAVYFLTLLFGQLLNGFNNPEALQYLTIFSAIAVFYIPFSIYYQWQVVKQWCRFCLTIQFLLFTQFVFVLLSNGSNITFLFSTSGLSWKGAGIFAGLGIFFFLLANQIHSLLQTAKSDKAKLNQALRVKFDPVVFDSILKTQKAVNISTEALGILLGDPNSKNKIIKVCNPYCGPCAKIHPIIDDLLDEIDDLSVQIIFIATSDDKDYRNKPVKHFLGIYETSGEELTKDSLNDWYTAPEKRYDLFAEKHKITGDLSKQTEKIDQMHDWCRQMNIEFTPTFFFNGYQLPENYSLTDIEYFLKS